MSLHSISIRRAAAYCRVSTDEQVADGYSLDDQRQRIAARIASQHTPSAPIVQEDTYVDEGYSGSTIHRPALRRLLADAEAGRINVVVFTKLDRLVGHLGRSSPLLSHTEWQFLAQMTH